MKVKMKITSTLSHRFAALLCVIFLSLATATATAQDKKILVVGDSLSAAYGMAVEDGWVAGLQHRLDGTRYQYNVINASVSGDTTANGLTKLPALLKEYQPEIVLIELGGNDGLRGLSLKKMKQNLIEMSQMAADSDATVIILGMKIPSNYGAAYTRLFSKTFVTAAEESNAQLIPFFLEGLEKSMEWFQSDGIHPNEKAQVIMLDNVWQPLVSVIDSLEN
ncbi:hypothetical protein AB833_32430 [Chromatiales bacterium (ex Bugula neritina AB1)]|nr:hypothetical protein AB833_32430 [Chromatiales bacterium (ex Bugula neritina AB1)]